MPVVVCDEVAVNMVLEKIGASDGTRRDAYLQAEREAPQRDSEDILNRASINDLSRTTCAPYSGPRKDRMYRTSDSVEGLHSLEIHYAVRLTHVGIRFL